MSEFDSVLLIAFGGPERPEDIRPFLRIVAAGRSTPPERLEEVAQHYEAMGGRSPLGELTRRQAQALGALLEREGDRRPVYVGMRNWHPFLHETLEEMGRRGHRRTLGIILSSFQTEASWERYVGDVNAAREKVGPGAPEVVFAPAWGAQPLFIDAMVSRAREGFFLVPAERRERAHLLFTAHSVPVAMAASSPYVAEFETAAQAIVKKLRHGRWSVAYQSRSGSPREPWLEPDIADAIRALAKDGAKDVVVAPIGFVCDHIEVLYDLDVGARQVAEECGVTYYRAQTANDHPQFIAMLADLAKRGPCP